VPPENLSRDLEKYRQLALSLGAADARVIEAKDIPQDLRSLYVAWRRHPILISAALYGGAPGLPAIFPRWAFPDLLELRGDRDPRLVLRRSVDRLVRVPMSNASIDLDTPEDLLLVEAGAGEPTPSGSRGD
jgi:CTP:molybdopterin cytidylyltransferase MocA